MISLQLDSLLYFSLAVTTGIMAGVYFTFSCLVMQSLNQLPASQAIAAMNSVNQVILRSLFMPIFWLSGLLAALILVLPLLGFLLPYPWLSSTASLVYLLGMLVVTASKNVPLNHQLQAYKTQFDSAQTAWQHYYQHWLRWNHVRTISSLVASSLSMLILLWL